MNSWETPDMGYTMAEKSISSKMFPHCFITRQLWGRNKDRESQGGEDQVTNLSLAGKEIT